MKKLVNEIIDDLNERMSHYTSSFQPTDDEVSIAACICEIENLRKIITEVHAWVVCAAIATPEDMAQNFERIEKITAPDYDEINPTPDKFDETFKALKELLEYVESEDSGIEEHDFFTDHDSDQCVLCKAREIVDKHEGR